MANVLIRDAWERDAGRGAVCRRRQGLKASATAQGHRGPRELGTAGGTPPPQSLARPCPHLDWDFRPLALKAWTSAVFSLPVCGTWLLAAAGLSRSGFGWAAGAGAGARWGPQPPACLVCGAAKCPSQRLIGVPTSPNHRHLPTAGTGGSETPPWLAGTGGSFFNSVRCWGAVRISTRTGSRALSTPALPSGERRWLRSVASQTIKACLFGKCHH